jgi:hypothetical protein
MKTLRLSLVLLAAVVATLLPASAQQQRLSPHETISAVIDGNRVTIVYGRPYTKHPQTGEVRKIWGGLVPYGQVWRTGADEATLLITQKPIQLGTLAIPAGAYTLWTLPSADGRAKLIVNKQIGQWGQNQRDPKQVYDEALDLGRVDLEKETLEAPVAQFTISLTTIPSGGGTFKMAWEGTQYSVPITVKK